MNESKRPKEPLKTVCSVLPVAGHTLTHMYSCLAEDSGSSRVVPNVVARTRNAHSHCAISWWPGSRGCRRDSECCSNLPWPSETSRVFGNNVR